MKNTKYLQKKSPGLKSSGLPEGGIKGRQLNSGDILVLDGKEEVEIHSQRILRNFTKVIHNGKVIEVETERLTDKPND